ncbi:hypothetical protein NKJ87_19200 [Mesorhizobium sp. M0027]|uniref:hypothetical protein n=1 Tax=Mesorhizobium sp. M0027 TaxID=2956848 RepID=UPI00333E0DA5
MDFERRHVLGNLLRDEIAKIFLKGQFLAKSSMHEWDGWLLLCRMCEYAHPKASAC